MRFIRLKSNECEMTGLAVLSVVLLVGGCAYGAGAAAEDTDAVGAAETITMEVQDTAEAGGAMEAAEETAAGDTTKAGETAAADTYPLETCVVSGAKLGSMGEPVVYVHDEREVKFCCGGCLSQFKENPEKYMEKLRTVGDDPADEKSEP